MSKKKTFEEFVKDARYVHGDKFTYNEETKKAFNGSHSVIPIICPIHGKYEIEARLHLLYDCKACSYEARGKKFRYSNETFIEKARKVHGDKYDYSKVEYINSHSPIETICPKHGKFKQLAYLHLQGEGCPYCKESHLERELSIILNSNGIDYERLKHFEWLGKQELDFFLPKYNIAIECQGKQHFGLGGWGKRFDHLKLYMLDTKKKELCNKNGIKLIYTVDKPLYNKALEFELYNENNIFHDANELLNAIKNAEEF